MHHPGVKSPSLPPAVEISLSPLRVLLIDDGAHRVALIRNELTRQGHEVVGVIDSAIVVRPVVVFAEDDSDEPLQHAMQAGVSAYVVAGLQPHRLASVLKVAIARFEQDKSLREQLLQAESELSSRRVVERAKAILMQQGGLSEDAAHKQLRKLAMDRGEKLVPLAERIIDAHELLKKPSA